MLDQARNGTGHHASGLSLSGLKVITAAVLFTIAMFSVMVPRYVGSRCQKTTCQLC
jgi:hypothetical protein